MGLSSFNGRRARPRRAGGAGVSPRETQAGRLHHNGQLTRMACPQRHRICTLLAFGVPSDRAKRRNWLNGKNLCKISCRRHGPLALQIARRVGQNARCPIEEAQTPTMNILVIDDDASLRRTLRMSLEVLGHRAVEARDGTQALELLGHRPFEMALLDLRLAQEQGLDLLPRLLGLAPGLHVVIVTAYATIETAVEAMRRGAFDYLPKPFTPDQLRVILDRIARVRRLQSQVDELEEQVRSVVPEVDLQTSEPKMREALDVAFKTAASEATILLRGESGTGKGVLARAIHARSQRRRRSASSPFTAQAFPPSSWRASSSGTSQGAFTGARAGHGWKGGRRGRRHPVPRRNRRPAAGFAAQALAAAPGTVLRAGGRNADAGQQRSHPRGHQPQPGGRACRRPLPRRPLSTA